MASPRARRWSTALLRPFSKVEAGEVGTLAIMAATAFLLLTAYYLLKTVREPLILVQGGAETKIYARASQAFVMVFAVHLYGELAKRVGRRKLLLYVFLFFIANLIGFALLARTQVQIGLPFFLWVGVFSYTVVAQFWALAADIYSEEQGKRLFPIIGGGSSLGALAGAKLAAFLMKWGAPALMGGAVLFLFGCLALIAWVERRSQAVRHDAKKETPTSTEGAFHLLLHDKYLLFIAGLAVALNWVNSSGEYLLDRALVASTAGHPDQQALIGVFKANYFLWYNLIGVVVQLFFVSRVLKLIGVRGALFIMPVFSLFGYAAAAFFPVLACIRLVKIGENSLQYSLQDTTRHALFLVTSRAEKFVGKTAVDTVAVRLGSVMSAIMVYVGARIGLTIAAFATVNVLLAVAWMLFVVLIAREHRRRSDEREAHAEPVPA